MYRDVIRVKEGHRTDKDGELIKEGQVCLVRANGRECYAVLRGFQDSKKPHIHMDEYTRQRKLNVAWLESYEFEFKPVGFFGQLRWAWNATEVGYQVSSKLALLGFVMGVLGLLFSIAAVFDWHGLIAKVVASVCWGY